ncbi:probable serine/threonine-protein kinase PBL19 isoform X2 [Phoenix dactylifera]|uniref:non-specific serine/threonine protein kinase n=1 Tax=Phoenix dactylifera TaxID=42345 RepID=A0A8B8ZVI4_PHODC|nr:probable serine/threonine-protein kinase PBL19 isoform X2 [Phoenix dactylifera]
MRCFFYLKEKFKGRKQPKSSPTTGSVPVSSSTANNGGSRSEDSGAAKRQSKSSGSVSSQRSIPELYEERAHNLRVFELKELRNATNDFSRLLKIGEGGFGSVYKGWIKPPDGKGDNIAVAVKKLNPNGLQGHKQWLAEVQFLGVVGHPNLVKLIGYCAVDGERGAQRLLVYEFVPNRSLEDHLFNKAYPSLPWNIRLQIALGAAEGLVYLHEGLEVQVMGTYGYAAPDYVETGHLTAKSDVWSFGVVLYEILTGRHSTERDRPRNEQKLLDWVKQFPVEGRKFSMIMDPRLENKYSLRAAREIAKLANRCLSKHARERPKMTEVVESLKQAMQHEKLDGEVESVEGNSPTHSDDEKKTEQEAGLKSSRRRMLHLAKLRESANAVGRRRFMLMKAANPT